MKTISTAKLRWYAHRLRAMGPAEWRQRLWDQYRHATQEHHLRRVACHKWDSHAADVPQLPDLATAPAHLRVQLAKDADELLQGRWTLFGWLTTDVGPLPNWHRDPISGASLNPETISHRLNHRHLPEGADARAIWEFNRWSEMTRLAIHG